MPLNLGLRLAVCLLLVSLGWFVGCRQKAKASNPRPPAMIESEAGYEEMITDWLRARGEQNIVRDAHGVGLAGQPTRVTGRMMMAVRKTQVLMQVQFRVRLPQGEEMIEDVAGLAEDNHAAAAKAFESFATSTLEPVYQAYLNPRAPRLAVEFIGLAGEERELLFAPAHVVSQARVEVDLRALRPGIKEALLAATLPANGKPIWCKIVCSQKNFERKGLEVYLNNAPDPALVVAMGHLDWPVMKEDYIAKQFVLIK